MLKSQCRAAMEGMLEIVRGQAGDHLSSQCVPVQLCWRIETNLRLVGVLLAGSNQAGVRRILDYSVTLSRRMLGRRSLTVTNG